MARPLRGGGGVKGRAIKEKAIFLTHFSNDHLDYFMDVKFKYIF